MNSRSAAVQGLQSCHCCFKTQRLELGRCRRCGARLKVRKVDSLQRTWALLLTSVVLYVPANLLPIMTTDQLGRESPATILGGVVLLWEHGSWPIAAVIFVASVLVPLGKLLALGWLCYTVQANHRILSRERTVLYRLTEFIGRWSMVDVFVVAVLVSLIRLGNLISIYPGPAALSFAGLVVLTMLAAMSFDARLIWDAHER